MAFDDFEQLLKDTIGLDVASIGRSAVARAVLSRTSACALTDPRAYWDRVRTSDTELQALIETVVVPETWFFRDREAFALLARVAVEEWLPERRARPLRVLSLPCSTGEEPYSIAMALLDAGVPAEGFFVDAVDISQAAIVRAQLARYGKNSFRGLDLAFRNRDFEATAEGYRLINHARQQVHFRQGNLFSLEPSLGSTNYDAIFCRNLMIYFDRPTQDSAIQILDQRLASTGMLFVAPSEAAVLMSHAFTAVQAPLAFAFRKAAVVQREHKPTPANSAQKQARHPAIAMTSTAMNVRGVSERVPVESGLARVAPEMLGSLDEVARLADEGNLGEAATLCQEHVRRCGPSARAFHLLGMVLDAAGHQSEAVASYQKALYLDPDQQEVLLHMALIMEKRGRQGDARRLRRRASRARPEPVRHDVPPA